MAMAVETESVKFKGQAGLNIHGILEKDLPAIHIYLWASKKYDRNSQKCSFKMSLIQARTFVEKLKDEILVAEWKHQQSQDEEKKDDNST
jgi:hypothetical protein